MGSDASHFAVSVIVAGIESHFSVAIKPREPSFVCKARTQMCTHVKDPVSIKSKKEYGLTVRGMETRKHRTQKKKRTKKAW